ncbi:MAG: DNA polymerase III subunit delta [Myxococcales bacterium]|nr:DNA polymerase III subunit delta [Myxococcales bacterium]MCB9539111.1 DNA polymerase III subunit delta [Myxococcales bacterium]
MSAALKKALAGGDAPVYLLHGDEAFLTRQAAAWLRHAVLGGVAEDFNLDRFDARESFDPGRVVQAARTLPMMAARRLVWVRNAGSVFDASGEAMKALVSYVDAPDPSSCLVFEASTRARKTGALYKRIAKKGVVHESTSPRERELPAWVEGCAEGRGRTIRADAAALLVQAIGRDLASLDAAVERLALYVEPPGAIELAHVEETVAHTRARTVWELTDALADRKIADALARAHQLLDQGEEPLRLLAMVIRQYRQLLLGRSLRAAGASAEQAAQGAGVPPFRARTFARQLNNYRGGELVAALERLAQADRALKSSKVPGDLLLEGVLLDLCAGGGR